MSRMQLELQVTGFGVLVGMPWKAGIGGSERYSG